ncbi:Protein of unknown function [Pyronema omphalodes CBS 100304]|uniref:Uncharacterized protein n=1 Tax=Pyronema omphalodes (strain CBS 100304) TaxID=1076935 RepID=U4LL13_PYROM|nr:Protein of unknown function [Pyronema omphalodes CBS 100304]
MHSSRVKLLQSSSGYYSISKCSYGCRVCVYSLVPPHKYISLILSILQSLESGRGCLAVFVPTAVAHLTLPYLTLPRNQHSSAAFPIPGLTSSTRAGNKRASANSWTTSPSQGKESLSAK